jgi:type II secretory pathway pseudopilin PulG
LNNIKNKFSLIELMLVLAITGILLSLLLPALSKARKKSKTSVCLSNQKQIAIASFSYAGENNFYLPAHYIDGDAGIKRSWDDHLGMGYDGRELSLAEANDHSASEGFDLYVCPTDDTHDNHNFNRSYSAIQGKMNASSDSKRGPISEGSGKSLKLTKITYPSSTILISERHSNDNKLGKNTAGMLRTQDIINGTINGNYLWNHGNFKYNHLMIDGSARAIQHTGTYLDSGIAPWSNTKTNNTMWDSFR